MSCCSSQSERNYHIFYQLCSSAAGSRLGLGSADQYTYLSQSGCIRVDGIDDVKEFEEVQTAMTHLNFEQEESDWMFTVTAGVLTIGNVAFNAVRNRGADDSSEIRDMAPVQAAAQYLDVDASQLARVLLNRSIEVRGERSVIPLDPTAARDGADALAKFVYGKLFDCSSSASTVPWRAHAGASLGSLTFSDSKSSRTTPSNSSASTFSEKLQQHFNKHTFKEEEQVYISEGVPYERCLSSTISQCWTSSKDSQGLLVMLDEKSMSGEPMSPS